jgi:hypothetical protein
MKDHPGNQVAEPVSHQKIKRRRQLLIMLFCITIATALWFLRALENQYQTEITHPVQYINLPENYVLLQPLPRRLTLKVEGLGFSILRHNWDFSKDPLIVDFTDIRLAIPRKAATFRDTVQMDRFIEPFSVALGDLKVTGFKQQQLFLDMAPKR